MENSDKQPQQPQLPPGFRFHPTDEELVVHYLIPKAQSAPLPVSIIAELDLYKFDPWELPEKAVFGEQEWYFFSPRDRKYPNGARPNRAATSGYWKATGTDKPILRAGNHKVGVKKALVFYGGKPPKGVKTNWIMHEYRLADNNNNKPPHFDHSNNKKRSLRLDDWVLCRIYKKNNNANRPTDHEREDSMEEMMMMGSMAMPNHPTNRDSNLSKSALNYIELGNDNNQGINYFQGMIGNQHGETMKVDPTIAMVPSSGLYWGGASNSGKIHDDNDDYNSNNSSNNNSSDQLLHQQTMLGALSDGVMLRQPYQQLPGLNWYS